MLHTDQAQILGPGLWYLPQVFDIMTYREIRRCYRQTVTGWQCLYPNRLMSLPNNPDYGYLAEVALDINLAVSELTGHQLRPLNQEIFIVMSGQISCAAKITPTNMPTMPQSTVTKANWRTTL